MLRRPPFNVQADRAGGEEARDVLSVTSGVGPAHNHEGKQGLLLWLPANHWLLRGSHWGTDGLMRWRLVELPRLELSHSDLSALQGWTHTQTSCQSERLHG